MIFPTLFSVFVLLVSAQNPSCYYPDGSVSPHDIPCRSATVSTCCGDGFACLENGVCQVTTRAQQLQPSLNKNLNYFRGSCTDQTWTSSDCPQFCIGTQYAMDGGNSMQFCSSNKFCCYGGECDCGSDFNTTSFDKSAVAFTTIGVDQATTTSTSSSSSSSSSSSTSTTPTSSAQATDTTVSTSAVPPTSASTSATSSSTSSPSSDGSLSTGAKAGIGVGVPLGVIALAAVGFLLYRRLQHQTNEIEGLKSQLAQKDVGGKGGTALSPSAAASRNEITELHGYSSGGGGSSAYMPVPTSFSNSNSNSGLTAPRISETTNGYSQSQSRSGRSDSPAIEMES